MRLAVLLRSVRPACLGAVLVVALTSCLWSAAAVAATSATALSVRDFGAVGDGINDDAPAFRAALEAAAEQGGATVLVPSGRYRLVSAVTIDDELQANLLLPDGCRLRGVGHPVLIAAGPESCNAVGALQKDDIAVTDLSIVNDATGGLRTWRDGIKLEGCTRISIHRVRLRGLYIGVGLYGCRQAVVSDCLSDRCDVSGFVACDYADGVKSWRGTRKVMFAGCRADGTKEQGFRICGVDESEPIRGVTLVRCVARSSGQNGVLLRWARGCSILACVSAGNGSSGIELNGSERNLIAGCFTLDNGRVDPWGAGISMAGEPEVYGETKANLVTLCSGVSTKEGRQRYGYREWQGGDGNLVTCNVFSRRPALPEFGPATLEYANALL